MLGQGVRRRTHCALRAPFKQLRQVSARSACVLRHTHAPPALRFSARAEGNPGSGHPHGPLLRCAALGPVSRAQAPRAAQTGPSAAMARMDVGCLDVRLSHPCWLRLRRGGCGVSMGVAAPMPRALTRRGCLNEAAKQRSEFHGAPRNRPAAGCPVATRRGRRLVVAFLLGTFLWRSKEQVPRPPGRDPAPALKKHSKNNS